MRLPSLKFLKTFQVAARLQSFKAAAEELFVTPSAISHQIKALEEQLGVSLFQRGVRTLTLTDAGRNYLEHINDIFSKLESVTEQLQERYGRTIIRLNVPSFFANELLLPRLASFSQAREETDIRIETTFSAPKTHPPEADLSIVVGAGPWDGLVVHELFAQNFIAACSPAFLLDNPIDTYADLNGKTLAAARGAARGLGEVGSRSWDRTDQAQPAGAPRYHVGGGARCRARSGRRPGAVALERRPLHRRRSGEIIRSRTDHQ